MPSVTVNLYAGFREHSGGRPSVTVSFESEMSIEQLLNQLGVPVEEVRIIFCNNRLVDASHTVAGGESIGVFPAVGGG